MTKAIWILIILVAGYIGYLMFKQWDKARLEHAGQKPEQAAALASGDSLAGMPYQLDASYRTAKANGPAAFRAWFTANEKLLTDPRKAWIELELCVVMTRDNPAEAKKIYAAVKGRVPPSSPVYGKVKELEKTFGP
jgi:arginase family enzyme